MSSDRCQGFVPGCMVVGLLLCLLGGIRPALGATDFSVTQVAREEQQSRHYENTTDLALLRAGTGVLQDIGFQVIEVERSAGLIVALSPPAAAGLQGHSVTVNLVPEDGGSQRFRVRVTMVACCVAPTGDVPGPGIYADFYQSFFTHLRRELHRQRSLQ